MNVEVLLYMYAWATYIESFVTAVWPHVAVLLTDVQGIEDPLNKVEAGLVGGDIPLQSVHIKAKLIDLAAQVNTASSHIHSILFNRW